MLAYVFPMSRAEFARLVLDDCNVSEPRLIPRGPHAGKMFIDSALAQRDPRWIPLFQPLIEDPANEVTLEDLDLADLASPPKE